MEDDAEIELPKFELKTNVNKWWPYDEYCLSEERDCEDKPVDKKEYHWSGAESLEWYHGTMLNNTMHGYGEYRRRHKVSEEIMSYEGYFYANRIHGYGIMSYSDGTTFTGLFKKDVRWGPGIEAGEDGNHSKGFWCGTRLIRLAWKPSARSPFPDLTRGPNGLSYLYLFRKKLLSDVKIIGSTNNNAIELLKSYGCDPIKASKIWPKLYSKYCTDPDSLLFNKDLFDNEYYDGTIFSLLESAGPPSTILYGEDDIIPDESIQTKKYLAWNNSDLMLDIMKHSYQHEIQRPAKINLPDLLNGQKKAPHNVARHEIDSRSLLMASYLGHIETVAELVNHSNVSPDVADIEGNSALMYAVCGDQYRIVHFLAEAGGSVNCFNDYCYNPLGLALMRYLIAFHNIANKNICDAFLQPKGGLLRENIILNREEWLKDVITPRLRRDSVKSITSAGSNKSTDTSSSRLRSTKPRVSAVDSIDEDRPYDILKQAYSTKATTKTHSEPAVRYLFQAKDIFSGKSEGDDDVVKITSRVSKGDLETDIYSEPVRLKRECMFAAYETITQLLKDGADPKLVTCPWPALLMAVKTGSPEIVLELAEHGADLNECFPEQRNYRAIDIVMAEPLTMDNLEIVKILLENGADVTHTLPYFIKNRLSAESPNLFHVLMLKRALDKRDIQMIELCTSLFLQYNCDPYNMFKGQSAIGMAMNKDFSIMEAFITHPNINLNAPVNSENHSILFRILDFFPKFSDDNLIEMITGLLLHGADPLLPCYDDEKSFGNLFVFAKKTMRATFHRSGSGMFNKGKRKQNLSKSEEKLVKARKRVKSSATIKSSSVLRTRSSMMKSRSSLGRIRRESSIGATHPHQYGVVVEILKNFSRVMYMRRLQAQLMKELFDLTYKFKHWTWNTIIREHKNRENLGMWLTPFRCLEIWNIFQTTNKKKYKDEAILKHALAMILYYQKRIADDKEITPTMTTAERYAIDAEVRRLIRNYKREYVLTDATNASYIKPELHFKKDEKYNVCFECLIPLSGETIQCDFCGLVSFCNLICMSANNNRSECHPCSMKLKALYFPTTDNDTFPAVSTTDKGNQSFSVTPQSAASVAQHPNLSYLTSSTNAHQNFSGPVHTESSSPRDSFYLPPSVTNLKARQGFSFPAPMDGSTLRLLTSLSNTSATKANLSSIKFSRESQPPETLSITKERSESAPPETLSKINERRESAPPESKNKERRESAPPESKTKERRESAPPENLTSTKMRNGSAPPTTKNKLPVTFEDTERGESAPSAKIVSPATEERLSVTIKDIERRQSAPTATTKARQSVTLATIGGKNTLPLIIKDAERRQSAPTTTKKGRQSITSGTIGGTKARHAPFLSPVPSIDTGRRISYPYKGDKFSLPSIGTTKRQP